MQDAVDRLTPLGLMVLALLREDDMHPYEMIRLMRHRHDDRLVPITNGTVYHTVDRLTRTGLLAEVGVDREGNRPERTSYTLTDAGRDAVLEWVRRELPSIERPGEFRIALAEAHNLDLDEVTDLLSQRRAGLIGAIALHRDGFAKATAKGVPTVYLVEIEREATLLEADLNWLEDLLARLERGEITWSGENDSPSDRYLAQREAARR